MDVSASTAAWIAIGAGAVALVALLGGGYFWLALRKVRAAQISLGDESGDGLVDFAVSLQAQADDLRRAVDEVAAALARVDRRVDGCLARTAVVRFDAYEDAGGHQSTALALLDGARTGLVISAIQGRDYARIYVKDIHRGRPTVALSPEEQEAVERAMASG